MRLGDTILLTALLAKLREQHPQAEIVLTTPIPMVPLYALKPYDITVWPFGLRKIETVMAMFEQDDFDLAIVPGDNRHSWLAAALNAKWIIAHGKDRPFYKNWMVDEAIAYPSEPTGMGDIFAQLIPGKAPQAFRPDDWPRPPCDPFELPVRPYVVLHVGASTPLRMWEPAHWRSIATWLTKEGIGVVWSGGENEDALVATIDPNKRHLSYAGLLDLPQLWELIANALICIAPDTGVSHLTRLTGTPLIMLFGPGSATLFGRGDFWRETACEEIGIDEFPCRDGYEIFRRRALWIRHCSRDLTDCETPSCMNAIGPGLVISAIQRRLSSKESPNNPNRLQSIGLKFS